LDIVVSVVIVNYKVLPNLRQALQSLCETENPGVVEVIVVDNDSSDGSAEVIGREFPEVKWIQLKQNIGFGKACNVGAKNAAGEYLLFLNPDTIIARDTLSIALNFMREHPEAGIVGPKLLNADGTMQPGCRRGFPTPWAAVSHFFGLSRLFPESKLFGHYHQTWKNPDESCTVDAISGSFMFMRRELFERIGGFDERFFMYGEDLDLCWRVKEAGSAVWYHPVMRVIHLKGKSSARRLLQSRIAFYEAMVLFSRKYQHSHGGYFPGWLIYFGILIQASANIGVKLLHALAASFIDVAVINIILWASLSMRFASAGMSVYGDMGFTMLWVHLLLTGCFLGMFAYNGIYSQTKYSPKNAILSGFFASVIFMACVYNLKSIAFSRIAFGGAALGSVVVLVAWRQIIPRMRYQMRRVMYARERVLIVGSGIIPQMIIRNLEGQKTALIAGILWVGEEVQSGQFEGYPVLGRIDDIADILQRVSVDSLIIATPSPWYSYVIEALAKTKAKNLVVRWVPRELFDRPPEELPSVIPLHDFTV
jgi:hypothetical protein